ncbi:MAG: cation diffusion facilitator family transporter [Firmicutes bacterium]|nr:cation diffusion facilitator family transporter [Bacillota bacterium]
MSEKYQQKTTANLKKIRRASINVLFFNLLLAGLKLTVGFIFMNVVVISDGIHSLTDLGSTFLVVLATIISKPKGDKDHNYGHEKIESLLVLFFGMFLVALAVWFIWQGINGILQPLSVDYLNKWLIGVTAFSIVVKELLYHYTMRISKKTNSNALKADAWHQRIDAMSSIAVLIGLALAAFIGSNMAESIAIIVVALFILKAAWGVIKPSLDQLIDKAADNESVAIIRKETLEVKGVIRIDELKTRLFGGSAIYVDIEIGVDAGLSLEAAHQIAEEVHLKLEALDNPTIKHCNVHVNPV